MMTAQTVQQILSVFRHFRDNHSAGMPLRRSYRDAVRAVANADAITYQTVGDGCRRRLGLRDINELYEFLAAWVRGEPGGLVNQLKENADPSAHAEIDQFFSGEKAAAAESKKTARNASLREESEPFTFRIAPSDARMLKALAELEGISAPELTARIVRSAVQDRITVVARDIINSTGEWSHSHSPRSTSNKQATKKHIGETTMVRSLTENEVVTMRSRGDLPKEMEGFKKVGRHRKVQHGDKPHVDPDIQTFIDAIGARLPQANDAAYDLFETVTQRGNYFMHAAGFLIVKISRSEKPFWGVGRKHIDFLKQRLGNYFLILLDSSISGYLFDKRQVEANINRTEWSVSGPDYKINMPLPMRNAFHSIEQLRTSLAIGL